MTPDKNNVYKKAKKYEQTFKGLNLNDLITLQATVENLLYKIFKNLPRWNKNCDCKTLESGFTFLDENEIKDICLKCGGFVNTSINYFAIWKKQIKNK